MDNSCSVISRLSRKLTAMDFTYRLEVKPEVMAWRDAVDGRAAFGTPYEAPAATRASVFVSSLVSVTAAHPLGWTDTLYTGMFVLRPRWMMAGTTEHLELERMLLVFHLGFILSDLWAFPFVVISRLSIHSLSIVYINLFYFYKCFKTNVTHSFLRLYSHVTVFRYYISSHGVCLSVHSPYVRITCSRCQLVCNRCASISICNRCASFDMIYTQLFQ